MSRRVLFIGSGNGSWEIRGRQVARAIGARATVRPTEDDLRWADVIILVKRAIDRWGHQAKSGGQPVIWDVLDFWNQPEDNGHSMRYMVAAVNVKREDYRVDAVIGATRAMADAIGGVYIPHPVRPGLRAQPVKDEVKVVAYEGTSKYLGTWASELSVHCADRGWQFRVNPPSISEADIIVAFRDEQWDGPVCREWKSGVKCVNAIGAGRPILTQPSAGFREIAARGIAIDHLSEIGPALDAMSSLAYRTEAFEMGQRRAAEFSIAAIAARYRSLIHDVATRAA